MLAEYVPISELEQVNVLLRILQDLPITDLGLLWFPCYREQISPATLKISPGLAFSEKRRGGGEWCRHRSLCQGWGSPFSSAGWFAGWDCLWLGNDLDKSKVKDYKFFLFWFFHGIRYKTRKVTIKIYYNKSNTKISPMNPDNKEPLGIVKRGLIQETSSDFIPFSFQSILCFLPFGSLHTIKHILYHIKDTGQSVNPALYGF